MPQTRLLMKIEGIDSDEVRMYSTYRPSIPLVIPVVLGFLALYGRALYFTEVKELAVGGEAREWCTLYGTSYRIIR